jgi:hypothetical protein
VGFVLSVINMYHYTVKSIQKLLDPQVEIFSVEYQNTMVVITLDSGLRIKFENF